MQVLTNLERVNRILKHSLYKKYYNKIVSLEVDREFCKHDMVHFLDVARIGYIMILEESYNVNKEVFYACALLHDIGRFEEYEKAIPHEMASASLCPDILKDCGYTEGEISDIQKAILNHRNQEIKTDMNLSGYIYRADKASRPCHICKLEKRCNWDSNKKNMTINY